MHFSGAGAAHHADNFAAGGAANDGVVDEDDALAFEQIVHRVELEADAEVADALLGLDKCAADVVVADEAEAEGHAGFFRVAERGGHAGVGHGHDDIGGHAGLARELAAHLVARLLHPAAEDARVGAREVDVLEDAARLRNAGGVLAAGDAVFGDHDQFAGKNVADDIRRGADRRRRFREAKTMVSGPSGFLMRPMESGRKPRGSRAAKMRSRVIMTMENAPSTCESESAMASTSVPALGVRDELDDDFGVGGGLEVGALALEARAQVAEVDQVAVVRDGDEALGGVDADGLRVEQRRIAGGGVARVADGHVAGQLGEHVVGEDFRDQAHALDVGEVLAVGGGDAG